MINKPIAPAKPIKCPRTLINLLCLKMLRQAEMDLGFVMREQPPGSAQARELRGIVAGIERVRNKIAGQ